MLLQKTGWRIKQFIAHRRNNSHGESGETLPDDRSTDKKSTTVNSGRISWLSPAPAGEVSAIQRANSSATIRNRLLMPASPTAHSSASSLCSCECETIAASTNHSLFVAGPTPTTSNILYLPPLSSTNTSSDAKAWRLIFSENLSRSPASSCTKLDAQRALPTTAGTPPTTTVRGSTFDLLEALALDPVDDNRTQTQSLRGIVDSDMEELSENVEQLIRETDEAFRAVGSALADAKAATEGWYDTPISTSKPLPRIVATSPGALKKQPRPPVSPLKSQNSRYISVSKGKGKRKKPSKKKTTFLGKALRQVPPTPSNTPPRWTLTDMKTNMADVFGGKMFRTEVEEMLTPDRMQKLKDSITVETERKASEESVRSVQTDGSTPTEPFHLESLLARITAAQKDAPTYPNPIVPSPALPNQKQSSRQKQVGPRKVQFVDSPLNDTEMVFKDLKFPSPPRMPMSRSTSRNVRLLATIPETLTPRQSLKIDAQPPQLLIPESPSYMALPSTAFTLTSPLFRHGHIRLERILGEQKQSSPDDEPLDWTAFQMAISGTIDEDQGERYGEEWEADEIGEDDIMEWWATFGFGGAGELVQETPVRERLKVERDMKEVVVQKVGAKDIISKPPTFEKELAADIPKMMTDISIARKGSLAESLPPSPMLDLLPGRNTDAEVIPMGYNLGHDLGDFLQWETDHVQSFHVQQ